MPGKISILKESGETISSNVVSVFMVPDTQKKYLISTENTVDPHGLTILHVSEIVSGSLQKVATDEEWSSIKTIMRAIISGNVGSYQYLQPIEKAKASDQYSRDISVSASASKQMLDNYDSRDVNNTPTVEEAGVQEEVHSLDEIHEVAPGIGVVENTDSGEPVVENAVETPTEETPVNEAGAQETPAVVPPEESTMTPSEPPVASEVVVQQEPVTVPVAEVATPAVVPAAPVEVQTPSVAPAVVAPAPVASVSAPQPVAVASVPTPVVVEPHLVAASPVTLPVSEPAVQAIPEPVTYVAQADLYAAQPVAQAPVTQPAVAIPAGQITQDGVPVQSLGIKYEVHPSFSPDATLDEVVLASQEMFMEGTRNLIQTIQEKIYRDIYHKEAELKAREEMLNQREKMINEQMMSFMSNFAAMQQAAPTTVQQPTKIEVESDKK